MKNLFLCLLLIPAFVFADVPPPPAVIAQIPQVDQNFPSKLPGNNSVSQNANGQFTIKTKPSANKSTFNGSSCSGGSCTGGRPVTTTVNNGYGNTGTINTQAASTYGKMGAVRSAANKSFGPISTAFAVWQVSNWSGTQVWNLYDCVVYDSCHPNSVPQIPSGVPAPPQSAWEAPKGAYDPNATVATVFYDTSNQPMVVLYGVDLGSGSGSVDPNHPWVHMGINVSSFASNGKVYFKSTSSAAELKKYENLAYDKVHPEAFERPFTEQDLYNALVWNLEHMSQEIATAIMNALHDGGFLGAPDSTVFDPASYTSPAYTASDTGVAQQDKFTINQDGSISHQVIARPDLQGNQQLAPEKQPSTNPTNPTDPSSPSEKPSEKPSWEDEPVPNVDLPQDVIDLPNITSNNRFSLPSYCPKPISVEVWGAVMSFKYDPLCDLLRLIKPLVLCFAAISAFLMLSKGD